MRARRGTVLGLLAVLVLGLACGDPVSTQGDAGQTGPDGGAGERRQEGRATSGRDGTLQFSVNHMDCDHTSLGVGRLVEEARGRFCVVELTVENLGDSPRVVEVSAQKAFDAAGNAYDAVDTVAVRTLSPDGWHRLIDPGEQVTGVLVYDVPPDAQLVRLQLHDSDFSHGVDVAIP